MQSRLASAKDQKTNRPERKEKNFFSLLASPPFSFEVYSLSALIVEPVRVIFSQYFSRMDVQDKESRFSSVRENEFVKVIPNDLMCYYCKIHFYVILILF